MGDRSSRFSMAGIARSCQLPDDCQKGRTFVALEGRERVSIDNFRGICSYTSEEVRLTTGRSKISVRGKRLQIDYYTKDEIEISGFIEKIEYE